MKKVIFRALVFSALALFVSGMAWAQDGDKPADNMQILKEKIQGDKKLLVAANMNLTEKEAKAFWPVYESYQKDLTALNDRALRNVGEYAANWQKMTDDTAKKVVTEHLAIEGDRQKLRQSYLPKFAKVLPYKKVMRYYQLENKIQALVLYDVAKKVPLVE